MSFRLISRAEVSFRLISSAEVSFRIISSAVIDFASMPMKKVNAANTEETNQTIDPYGKINTLTTLMNQIHRRLSIF